MNSTFKHFPFDHGRLYTDRDPEVGSNALFAWSGQRFWGGYLDYPTQTGTIFGYVVDGTALLRYSDNSIVLQSGMYFSVPLQAAHRKESKFSIEPASSNGRGILIERQPFYGTFMIGGPIEDRGRLRYIDGCTDSLLIPPVKKGDPCLNALYFPPGTNQTPHTHPSLRAGVITAGRGECITEQGSIPLTPGQIFVIPTGALHSFRTEEQSMTVIAYHPDSDFGPQDEDHPMVNRTIVDGVSARELEEIRTR